MRYNLEGEGKIKLLCAQVLQSEILCCDDLKIFPIYYFT
jgi:hypothetical protein